MKLNDTAGYIREYQEEVKLWTLPAGVTFPAQPRGDTAGLWEAGTGKAEATHIWRCAWTQEWLAAQSSNPSRAEAALQQLVRVIDTGEWAALDVTGRDMLNAALEAANLGDPTQMQQLFDVQCSV